MIEQLFGSKTRVKLLYLFYSNPNRSFFVREITRKIDEQINSVRRELANLLSIGIISSNASESNNNKLYYEVNQDYEHYQSLAQIFGSSKVRTVKAQAVPEEEQDLKALGKVEIIIMTGQFTRDDRSGVDMVLVGDLNPTQVSKYVKEIEDKENREVRYTTMTLDEFNYRQEVNDRFLSLVLSSKHQLKVDNRPKKKTGKIKEEKEEE